jgi:2,3-bisphosphoglycerate-dependent phosphoglycerate mutase
MAKLILVRHGQSEWNALGIWTGQREVDLTDKGRSEARAAARTLTGLKLDAAYSSMQRRANDTLTEILDELGQEHLHMHRTPALNERDYGDLTGKNKWQVKEEHGEEKFMKWRRSWDFPVPGGETLKDVHARAVPYYNEHILPDLEAGKNVIVAAHGNTLRALVKFLEDLPESEVPNLEIGTGEVYVYDVDERSGKITAKDIKVAGGKA